MWICRRACALQRARSRRARGSRRRAGRGGPGRARAAAGQSREQRAEIHAKRVCPARRWRPNLAMLGACGFPLSTPASESGPISWLNLRSVLAGRSDDDAALRRNGPRSRHWQEAGRRNGRRSCGRQRARPGLDLPLLVTPVGSNPRLGATARTGSQSASARGIARPQRLAKRSSLPRRHGLRCRRRRD